MIEDAGIPMNRNNNPIRVNRPQKYRESSMVTMNRKTPFVKILHASGFLLWKVKKRVKMVLAKIKNNVQTYGK